MKKKLDQVNAAITLENVNKLDPRWPDIAYTNAGIFVQNVTASSVYVTLVIYVKGIICEKSAL